MCREAGMGNTRPRGCTTSSLCRLRLLALPCAISKGHLGCWEWDHGKSPLMSTLLTKALGSALVTFPALSPANPGGKLRGANGTECGAGRGGLPLAPQLPAWSLGHWPALIKLTSSRPHIQQLPAAKSP